MNENLYRFYKISRSEGVGTALGRMVQYIVREAPDAIIIVIFPIYTLVRPGISFSLIQQVDGIYKIKSFSEGTAFYIPELSYPEIVMEDIINGDEYPSGKNRVIKYTSSKLVSTDNCETIVDIGAYIGSFSLAVADQANKVIAIEPSPKSARCIRMNAEANGFDDRIEVIQKPVDKEKRITRLNISQDPTDNSLLGPDSHPIDSIEVETTTIDTIAKESGVERIDFLKMDAEGLEPEVLLGAEEVSITQLAIDCTEERDGESSFRELYDILNNRKYQIERGGRKNEDVLYAKLTSIVTTKPK